MATHGIIQLDAVHAQNIDALNRFATASADLDNGNIVQLLTKTGQVWVATAPAAVAGLQGLWMVAEPVQVLTGGAFLNIDVNPVNFFIATGKVFTAFKPQVADIITLSVDSLAGVKGANGFAVATAAAYKATWAAAAVSGLTLKLLGTSYISLADGSIGSIQRTTAYQFEVVAIV